MRFWITGARGFIGTHLACHLSANDHEVLGIGHGHWPEARQEAGLAGWLDGEIAAANLEHLLQQGGAPDCIVHLAGGSSVGYAIAHPYEDYTRTVTSTANLLEWVRGAAPAARVIAISSAAVYGAGHPAAITESAATHPFSPYGYHKLMMEQLLRSYAENYGISGLVLRLFSVFGPGLRKQLLWDLCQRMDTGPAVLELGGSGDELRDWTHVRDVVGGILAATELASTDVPVFNLATGVATPVRDVAACVVDAFGATCDLAFSGHARVGDPFALVADNASLAGHGIDCRTSAAEGIREYVTWYQQREGRGGSL